MPFARRCWMVYKAVDFSLSVTMPANRTSFMDQGRPGVLRRIVFAAFCCGLSLAGPSANAEGVPGQAAPAQAKPAQAAPGQGGTRTAAEAAPQAVPGFWDPRQIGRASC